MGIPVNNENVQKHLGLVHTIARKLHGKVRDNAISFDDLFSEGCIGLMKALEAFDSSSGNQFSTYAYSTIAGYIHSFIDRKGSPIRYPAQAPLWANRILKAELQDESPAVIAESLGTSEFYAAQALEYMRMRNVYSLDLPRKDMNGNQGDSDQDHSFLANTEDDISQIMVDDFLSTLDPNRQLILKLTMEGYTSREIAQHFNCSHQNIRQHMGIIREKYTKYALKKVIPFRKREETEMPAPEQLTKEFVEAEFANGKSAGQIERELGMKKNTIQFYLKKFGVKNPNPHGGKRERIAKREQPTVALAPQEEPQPQPVHEYLIKVDAALLCCKRSLQIEINGSREDIEDELVAVMAYVQVMTGKSFRISVALDEVPETRFAQ